MALYQNPGTILPRHVCVCECECECECDRQNTNKSMLQFFAAPQKTAFGRARMHQRKRSNAEPQGVSEALDRFVGKIIQLSTIWKRRQ